MKIILEPIALMPERAYKTDAGLDLKTPVPITVLPNDDVVVDTGVHIELPLKTVGMIKSRSGLNIKQGIMCEGVIDAGYTGPICVRLYNSSNKMVHFDRGDKIAQLVILPVFIPDELETVNQLSQTERGDNGFGSSGK